MFPNLPLLSFSTTSSSAFSRRSVVVVAGSHLTARFTLLVYFHFFLDKFNPHQKRVAEDFLMEIIYKLYSCKKDLSSPGIDEISLFVIRFFVKN
jgi:hypothetical protein